MDQLLIEFWQKKGILKPLGKIIIERNNPFNNDEIKKIFLPLKEDEVASNFQISFLNTPTENFYILDLDLNNKSLQSKISSGYDLNIFKCLEILYCEVSMNGGLHFLICLDKPVDLSKLSRKVLFEQKEFDLIIEFKKECIVSPSLNYKPIFLKNDITKLCHLKLYDLIDNITSILNEKSELKIANEDTVSRISLEEKYLSNLSIMPDTNSSQDLVQESTQKSISTKRKIENEIELNSYINKNRLNDDMTERARNRNENFFPQISLESTINEETNKACKIKKKIPKGIKSSKINQKPLLNEEEEEEKPNCYNSLDDEFNEIDIDCKIKQSLNIKENLSILKKYPILITDVYSNFRQYFDYEDFNYYITQIFLSLEKFDSYVSNQNNFGFYFCELQYFLSFLNNDSKDDLSTDDPFYALASTDKWIKWTEAYLNFSELLKQVGNSLSVKCSKFPDIHNLYRSITKRNLVGSQLSDNESRDEIFGYENRLEVTRFGIIVTSRPSFREKYNKPKIISIYPKYSFTNFVLVTLSIIKVNKKYFLLILKYLNLYVDNSEKKSLFYLTVFNNFLNKHGIKILKIKNPVKKSEISGCGFAILDGLPWQDLSNIFMFDLLSMMFPNLDSNGIQTLLTNILDMGSAVYLEPELIHVRSNIKNFSCVLNFENLKILLNYESDNYSGIFIENYKYTDLATDAGVIQYEFDANDYLQRGINGNILSLINESRYSDHFCATVRTLFSKDTISGEITLFGCAQFIIDTINFGGLFLKNKVLQLLLLQLGPGNFDKILNYIKIKLINLF